MTEDERRKVLDVINWCIDRLRCERENQELAASQVCDKLWSLSCEIRLDRGSDENTRRD